MHSDANCWSFLSEEPASTIVDRLYFIILPIASLYRPIFILIFIWLSLGIQRFSISHAPFPLFSLL